MLKDGRNEGIPVYGVLVVYLLELPFPQGDFLVNFVNIRAIADKLVEFLSPGAEMVMVVILGQIQLNIFEFWLRRKRCLFAFVDHFVLV